MEKQVHLETLSEIRSLMERSSRFLSLSGLSGVAAGVCALAGAAAAWLYLDKVYDGIRPYQSAIARDSLSVADYRFFTLDAGLVLIVSLLSAYYFTRRMTKKKGLKIWDGVARRTLINLMIPLAAGGLFCLALLQHHVLGLVAPATLIFYGLALINAGKYTLEDIRYLGICEIIIGLLAAVFVGYGLLFWAFGFGVLHIVYGIVMYRKYEA